MRIGEKIRNAREDLDLLQSDMARLIPMNQSNYSKIERGIQEPNLEQLRQICKILKLDPRYLLDIGNFEMNDFVTISSEEMSILEDAKMFISKYSQNK